MSRHLVIAGAQRCGTTWLAALLDRHPEITMARPSRPEPKVFCSEELTARGRAWYLRTWFGHAGDERLLGEKSTSYLEHPEAADRAARMLGDPLVLVQLRDPVERALSHWAFSTESGLEDRPLAEVLTANLAGPLPWDPARTSVSPYAYLERGRYADHLEPWLRRFGDDLTVVFLEEMLSDPEAVGALHTALGVSADLRPTVPTEPVNRSAHPKPALDPELRARVRDYFAESDRRLAGLLGRPLPWRNEDEPRGA